MGTDMAVRIKNVTGGSGLDYGLPKPLRTGSAAVYEYSSGLEHRFTRKDRFGEWYKMYRIVVEDGKKYIWLPRQVCPLGAEDVRSDGQPVHLTSKVVPRDEEQERVLRESKALLDDKQSFIIEAPTGTGKTVMGTDLIAHVNRKTLVVITKEDLQHQWEAALTKFLGIPKSRIGLIKGDKFKTKDCDVVIAYIQSLSMEGKFTPDQFEDYGLVIWDEVHRVGAEFFSQSVWLMPAALRLGLSATPKRKDGREELIYFHIGPVMVKSQTLMLKPRVLVIPSTWQVPLVPRKVKGGGTRLVQLPHAGGKINHINKLLMKDRERNDLIAQFVTQAYQKGRFILVMSELKDHLEELYAVLQQHGVARRDFGMYVGGMKKTELEKSKHRKVVLATYAFCSEGTDIPWLDTLVLATPRSDVTQIVGRILREYEGKSTPVVLDIVDRSSKVLSGYGSSRLKWYHRVGAEVEFMENG